MRQPGVSFPPLLASERWGAHTSSRGKGPARSVPRPLAVPRHTVEELMAATGERWPLLQSAANTVGGETRQPEQRRVPDTFSDMFGAKSAKPEFNVFNYCKRVGHAPPSVPAPPISNLSSWFNEYGRPRNSCPPGLRSEFVQTTSLRNGAPTHTVRMIRGRVLR